MTTKIANFKNAFSSIFTSKKNELPHADPSKLPNDTLINVFSQFFIPQDIPTLRLVNKSWYQIFGNDKFIERVLMNHPFLNNDYDHSSLDSCDTKKTPLDHLKQAYSNDKLTRQNIQDGSYTRKPFVFTQNNQIPIKMVKTFGNSLIALVNQKLLHIVSSDLIKKIDCQVQVLMFTVLNDRLIAINNDREFYEIKVDGSSTLLFKSGIEKDFLGDFDYFFESIDAHYIISNYRRIYVLNENGDLISNKLTKHLKIHAMTIFNHSLVCGAASGNIEFYDKNLNFLHSIDYKKPKRYFFQKKTSLDDYEKRPANSFTILNNQLVSGSDRGIAIWNADRTLKEYIQAYSITYQIQAMGNCIVSHDNNDSLIIWTLKRRPSVLIHKFNGELGFVTWKEKIVIFGKDYRRGNYIDFLTFNSQSK
ncbi:MAG: F-box protein [Parachlamydiales bacterium]|nr:F-box protein [Parachlamydiales bacterium]